MAGPRRHGWTCLFLPDLAHALRRTRTVEHAMLVFLGRDGKERNLRRKERDVHLEATSVRVRTLGLTFPSHLIVLLCFHSLGGLHNRYASNFAVTKLVSWKSRAR